MEFLEFIDKFWSQIGVLVFGFGYIIRSLFDWVIRKKDILFSKVYESKVVEIKEFLRIYFELEINLRQLPFLISQENIDTTSIKQKYRELTLKFKTQATYVRFFLKEKEVNSLDSISQKIESIIQDLNELEGNTELKRTDKELYSRLMIKGKEVFKTELPNLIREMEKNFKKDYKIE